MSIGQRVVINRAGTALERRTCPNRPNRRKDDSMAPKPLPDQAVLLKLLRYEPDTGKLYWRRREMSDFSHTKNPSAHARTFNSAWADREAFACVNHGGYRIGAVGAVTFLAHRIIWKMATGHDPLDIDHINGNRGDNRLINLRSVTRKTNLRNLSMSRRNKSGIIGVHAVRGGKWNAQIKRNGKSVSLGTFPTKLEAANARRLASQNAGFHENHGKPKKDSAA